MQNSIAVRKRPHPSSAARSPEKMLDSDYQSASPSNSENVPPASLFFPAGERRPDLDRHGSEARSKRLCVDAPKFSQMGLNEGLAAREPAASEALMGMATGALVYYGTYFEQNKMLRELTFERETRHKFGRRYHDVIFSMSDSAHDQSGMYAKSSSGGHPGFDDDDL